MDNQIVQSNMPNISATVHCSDFKPVKKRFVCTQHFHDEVELLCIKGGQFLCNSNGVRYVGEDGDIIFINSRIPHSTEYMADNTFNHMLQFNPDNFSNDSVIGISKYLSRFININKEQVVVFKAGTPECNELSGYLDEIINEYNSKKPAYELYIKANILNVIAFLSRNEYVTDSSLFFDEKIIEKVLPALNYIDTHYSEPITLEKVCGIVNLNPSYFCRLFKKATNSTFVEYLNFVRICKSERRLSASKESVAEIALSLGFASVSYFNKVFKKFKGCTPTEYKKSKYLRQ